MIIDVINKDLKTAMLAGDKPQVEVLKGLKTALQYKAVSKGAGVQLTEEESLATLKKEQKKRLETAEIYQKANDSDRANQELYEKSLIDKYLPASMSEDALRAVIDEQIHKLGGLDNKNMGQIIGAAKKAAGPTADGGMIAKLVKERL